MSTSQYVIKTLLLSEPTANMETLVKQRCFFIYILFKLFKNVTAVNIHKIGCLTHCSEEFFQFRSAKMLSLS